MSFKNDGLQIQEYYYDFAVDGGATGVFTLSSKANVAPIPQEAIITKVVTRVVTALAGASASAQIGNTASDVAYAPLAPVATFSEDAVIIDNDALVVNAANRADVLLSVTGGALTAGKLVVMVEYLHHA